MAATAAPHGSQRQLYGSLVPGPVLPQLRLRLLPGLRVSRRTRASGACGGRAACRASRRDGRAPRAPRRAGPLAVYSTFAPDAFTTGAHLSVSALITWP